MNARWWEQSRVWRTFVGRRAKHPLCVYVWAASSCWPLSTSTAVRQSTEHVLSANFSHDLLLLFLPPSVFMQKMYKWRCGYTFSQIRHWKINRMFVRRCLAVFWGKADLHWKHSCLSLCWSLAKIFIYIWDSRENENWAHKIHVKTNKTLDPKHKQMSKSV